MDQAVKSPRYITVYATIRDWIYQGTYKPGSQLPTEGELCQLFGVSRITTRKAVDMLVDEALVVRQPGRGTFVVEDLADAPITGDMEQLLRKVERASHVRLLNREPIGYVVTYIPADLEVRFDLNELNESPMLTLLERKGVDVASCDQVIGATLADARLAALLNTSIGAALVHVRLVVFDSRRRPVERLVAWYRADHYHHHVHLTRKSR
jgi:GntR family transcriptional regulator